MSSQKTSTLKVDVVFTDQRFTNLAIHWQLGTNRLNLVQKGDASGGSVVLDKVRIKGGIADPQAAETEAAKWFSSLPDMFDEDVVDADGPEEL